MDSAMNSFEFSRQAARELLAEEIAALYGIPAHLIASGPKYSKKFLAPPGFLTIWWVLDDG